MSTPENTRTVDELERAGVIHRAEAAFVNLTRRNPQLEPADVAFFRDRIQDLWRSLGQASTHEWHALATDLDAAANRTRVTADVLLGAAFAHWPGALFPGADLADPSNLSDPFVGRCWTHADYLEMARRSRAEIEALQLRNADLADQLTQARHRKRP